jgi:hypothetical protein
LNLAARVLVADTAFRTGELPAVDASAYVVEDLGLGRVIPLDPLRAVIGHAMRRLEPRQSDPWLAPRVHATVRLTRREAADRRIWPYLTVVELADYVRWRWRDLDHGEVPVPIDRFLGEDSKNALSRLWWAAELTRNGADYRPTVRALSESRFLVSWLKLNALHHKAVALAAVEFLDSLPADGPRDRQGKVMARALNVVLRTLSLDALSASAAPDAEAVRDWCTERVDETTMISDLPRGPDEPPVPEREVAAVRAVLDRLAAEIGLGRSRRRRRARAQAS